MTTKIHYTAIGPNGETHTRNSNRAYAYAVLALNGDTWGLWGFSRSFELAQKSSRQASNQTGRSENFFLIVPAHAG